MVKTKINTIRGKLALLATFCVFISALISIYTIYERTEESKQSTIRQTSDFTSNFMNLAKITLEKNQSLLLALSHVESVRKFDKTSTGKILSELLADNINIDNIILFDSLAEPFAFAKSSANILQDEFKKYLPQNASKKQLTVGLPIKSFFSDELILPISYPLTNASSTFLGTFVIGVKLNQFKTFFKNSSFSSKSVIGILDSAGNRLFRYPFNKDFSLDRINKAPATYIKIYTSKADGNDLETIGSDGVKRLYAYSKLRLEGNNIPVATVYVGIPINEANANANRILTKTIIINIVLIILIGIVFWLVTSRFLSFRLLQLTSLAKKIGAGENPDLSEVLTKSDEIGELALAFDNMLKEINIRELLIKESETRYRVLFEKMSQALVIRNEFGDIVEYNASAASFFDILNSETLNNALIEQICKISDEDGASIEIADIIPNNTTANETGKQGLIIGVYNERTKTQKWGLVNALPIRLPGTNELRIYTTITDITDRKRAEAVIRKMNSVLESRIVERTARLEDALEELKTANDEAAISLIKEREINELKTNFISMVSQKFRAPLTVISSSAFLLDRAFNAGEKEKHDKHFKKILLYVELMEHLINDLLILGKGEAGNIKITPEYFEAVQEIKEIALDRAGRENAKDRIEFDILLNSLNFNTDRTLFEYSIGPIISNAIRYSDSNTNVIIKAFSTGDVLTITITDKGIGFPNVELQRLFEPFYKFTNNTHGVGAGLGMSIAKRCLDLLGGSISVVSEQEVGTTVEIKIPSF